MQAQFQAAAFKTNEKIDNDYVNARYAPVGNEKVGTPFPLFRQPAGYFTDWTSSGQAASNYKRRVNLPTDNTLARNVQQMNGVNLANSQNTAFVFRSQTLLNNGDPISCRNNIDCESWPGTTCNSQHMSWPDAKGNQGSYCAVTKYPEIKDGVYNRKLTNQGGIGKACSTDNDCAVGYSCNNETDLFGSNIQQTGYCAQTYTCDDGSKHYLGYPYNSGIPIVPPSDQNNNGKGYSTKDECNAKKLGQQECKQDSFGKWYATYPGYCPVVPNLRDDSKPAGMFQMSSSARTNQGISIPAYATNAASNMGGNGVVNAMINWNVNATKGSSGISEPMAYEMSINPK